jgi:hypothetical protein
MATTMGDQFTQYATSGTDGQLAAALADLANTPAVTPTASPGPSGNSPANGNDNSSSNGNVKILPIMVQDICVTHRRNSLRPTGVAASDNDTLKHTLVGVSHSLL